METIGNFTVQVLFFFLIAIIIAIIFGLVKNFILKQDSLKKLKTLYLAIIENFRKNSEEFEIIKQYVEPNKEGDKYVARMLKDYEFVKKAYLYKGNFFKRAKLIAQDVDISPDYWVIVRAGTGYKPVQYKDIDPKKTRFIAGFPTYQEADINIEAAAELFKKEQNKKDSV